MRNIMWMTLMGWLCVAGVAAAQDATDRAMMQYHVYPACEKLGRGLGNAVGGWLEIPYQIQQRYAERDAASSLFTGAVIGLVKGVVRTGVGIYETVTFWLPLPEQFAPILPTLPYFNKAEPRKPLLLE